MWKTMAPLSATIERYWIGVRADAVGLRNRSRVLEHQRAHGKVLERLIERGDAAGLFGVHGFGVTREPVGDPDVRTRGGQHSIAPPLAGGKLRKQAGRWLSGSIAAR